MLGRPPRVWLELFLLTHRPDAHGWQRLEWPDGRPLLAQPWPGVRALRVLGDELDAIAAERRNDWAAERQRQVAAGSRAGIG